MRRSSDKLALRSLRWLGAAVLLAGALAGAARAGAIRPVQGWEDLDAEQRSRALQNYQRYQRLPKDQQREVDQQWQRWRGMDSQEQNRVRRNYESYRQLDKQQRRDFGQRYEQWRRGDPKGR